MYERFTDRARKIMQLANQEAQRFNHEYIGTEHILLGVVSEGSGVSANVLKNMRIDPHKVRREVEKIVQHGPGGEQVTTGRLPQTPRAKKVIDYAIDEARNLNHNYVGSEHLLLGLLREEDGVAGQVLMNLGLRLKAVREELLNLLGDEELKQPMEVGPIIKREVVRLLTEEQLRILGERIARLEVHALALTATQEVEQATKCREEAEALRLLLAWYVHLQQP